MSAYPNRKDEDQTLVSLVAMIASTNKAALDATLRGVTASRKGHYAWAARETNRVANRILRAIQSVKECLEEGI